MKRPATSGEGDVNVAHILNAAGDVVASHVNHATSDYVSVAILYQFTECSAGGIAEAPLCRASCKEDEAEGREDHFKGLHNFCLILLQAIQL